MDNNYGIYIHIPFCKARCGYCAFSSCCDYSLQQPYFDKLFAEMELRSDKSAKISTVYLGGGTPSSVETKYLDMLFDKLAKYFDLSEVCETTAECNPESVTDNLLACLKSNSVNRLSFGLQSANDDTLRRIGRIHRFVDFTKALSLADRFGFNNVNADLILGLPEEIDTFKRSVLTVADMPVKHISVYALELHENSPIYKLCKSSYDYDDDTLADMYDYACNQLAKKGFARYEISNFSKYGYECKHNINYWSEGRYFAFGAAASGFIGDVRYTNPYDIRDYISIPTENLLAAGEKITCNEQANEYVMLRLRLSSGVDVAEFERRYGTDFLSFFPNAEKLIKQKFLVSDGGRVYVPADKIYVTNSILTELLNF